MTPLTARDSTQSNLVPHADSMEAELVILDRLVAQAAQDVASRASRRLPGNAVFLSDGRVLCRPRPRGDSRYVYGRDGLHFWTSAAGYMWGNCGRFNIFLPAADGHEPRIAFFCARRSRPDAGFAPLPLLSVPHMREAERDVRDRYTVFGHDATFYHTRADDLEATLRVFLHQPDGARADLVFSLWLRNRLATPLELTTSAYFDPLCRTQFAESSEDRWFKLVLMGDASSADPGTLQPFQIEVNEDVDRFHSVTQRAWLQRRANRTPLRAEVCTSRRAYVGGPHIGLAQAACLWNGHFTDPTQLSVFSDHPIAGDLNAFQLAANDSVRLDYVFTVQMPGERIASPSCTMKWLEEAREATRRGAAGERHVFHAEFSGPDLPDVGCRDFNSFLPYLRRQVEVCGQTLGYMQPAPNSLVGIRDVFQAVEGLLYDDPAAARRKMSEALEYVLVDGRCPRQYARFGAGATAPADLREFVDQGCWVVSTIHTYLQVSGDSDFLNWELGYSQVPDGAANVLAPASERDSVLHHLLRIMDYLARQCDPETGLLRALYGDWNDALDGLGKTNAPGVRFGSGVSVMASLQLYQNCAEICAILRQFRPDQFADAVARYTALRGRLREGLRRYAVVERDAQRRIVHGWGDVRGYFVGSFEDSDGKSRDGLTSNAFWVLAGMLDEDPSLGEEILAAFERLDSPFGLRTFAPGFAPDAPGVGRIPKLPIGTAENGAVYVHATLFGAAALFMMGEGERAWAQIRKVLPFASHQQDITHSPFVMPNSYAYNPDLHLTGQNMNDWQTGSSNVLLKVLIRHVFGFQPGFESLRIAPAVWSPFAGFTFRGHAHGRRIEIRHRQGPGPRQFTLNGRPWRECKDVAMTSATEIPYDQLSKDTLNLVELVGG
jgi:hypothetical protein